ncbi:hypothetical protein QOZ80_7BG0601650 [Eleusine coracana subsp. coracana]|nr:hypothetical protein QOZ80_7BG0601650 [Eleusine coracana subsp. coracana]
MCSDEDFAISGPTHMMVEAGCASSPTEMIEIDWDNKEHRRCITACLVKGTYVLESDQTKGRKGPEALAPAWWESFHFRQIEVLESRSNKFGTRKWFIHGAIFKYVCPHGELRRHAWAPSYIVAFRGTMPGDPTFFGDMHQNIRIVLNKQHCGSRFRDSRKRVRELFLQDPISRGTGNVIWLAGHSLGASLALDVGRYMMSEKGCDLPAFLFNPPHVSLAPAADMLCLDGETKWGLYGTSYRLYVHNRDLICKGFIDYFEQRQQLQKRLPDAARSAATLAYRDLLHLSAMSCFGNKKERLHLLPSARLWKNSTSHSYFEAHELRQWWQPGLLLSSNLYSWP